MREQDITDIKDSLGKILTRISVLETRIENRLDDLTALEHKVYGNGKVGLSTLVDRLSTSEERRVWAFRAMMVAIIGLLVDVVHRMWIK
jgi:hypothetical protein